MPSPAAWPVFLTGFTLSLSLIVAIGAQNTFVLSQGLRREHVGVVVAVCALLDLTLMTLGVSGLAAALGQHPQALNVLGLAGAAALAWYGLQALRRALAPGALQANTQGAAVPLKTVLLQTQAISLLNPHVYLDTVVLVGTVGARQPAEWRGLFLAGASLGSARWFTTLGFGARLLTPWFARPTAWRVLDAVVALTMGSLASSLAWRSLSPA